MTTKLFLGTASAYFGVEGAQGAAQSFKEGKIIQGIYRMILSLICFVGAGKSYGEAIKTADAINNGATCFVAGTLVLTEDGEKPIESIKVGDYVYSTDPETGESDYKEVLNVFIRQSNIIIHVFVNGEEIETTPTHPFWVEDEWVTADKLKAGDVLTRADGTTCAIDKVYAEFSNKAITVYNFEVADFHSYYVTDTGVLVHNAGYKNRTSIDTTKNKQNDHPHGVYEKASYHGSKSNSIKNKAPNLGQEALDNSVPIKEGTTTRRVGISDGEIVVFDETTQGVFHGHVRSWGELSQSMQAALRKSGLVTKKGKIISD